MLFTYPSTVDVGSMEPHEAAAMRKTAKHLAKRPANIDWMLDLLSTISPSHEYFKKDFFKPKKVLDDEEVVQPGFILNK